MATSNKKQIITRWLENLGQLSLAIDLGATMASSPLLRKKAGTVIAVDQDQFALTACTGPSQ